VPYSREEAVALGMWLRSQPEIRYVARLPRKARPEDGTFVCVYDLNINIDLLVRSIMGELEGFEPAFPDVLSRARGLQRQKMNLLQMANANQLPRDIVEPLRAPPLADFVRTALYAMELNLGIVLDWKAFFISNGMHAKD
jgi:hypothetical protein